MSGTLVLPGWAGAVVAGLLGLFVLYVRWSLKSLHDRNENRLERMEHTILEIDRRLIRIERRE